MSTMRSALTASLIGGLSLFSLPATAAGAATLNSGNTAWMLTSTALVLFMTLPGLALFYAGLVRSKNVLSVLTHCFVICCLVSVLWVLFVYGLTFGDGGAVNNLIGTGKVLLAGVGLDALNGDIPETVYLMFQM